MPIRQGPSSNFLKLAQLTMKRCWENASLDGLYTTVMHSYAINTLLSQPFLESMHYCSWMLLAMWYTSMSQHHMGLSENRVYSQWNSHLIGIMISKTIGFRGTQHFQTNPYIQDLHHSCHGYSDIPPCSPGFIMFVLPGSAGLVNISVASPPSTAISGYLTHQAEQS